jgi:uncharacterized protein YicC (UPF0701 family)
VPTIMSRTRPHATLQLDRRATETYAELGSAQRQWSATRARAEAAERGSPERTRAEQELRRLNLHIGQLERALAERPWTEASS